MSETALLVLFTLIATLIVLSFIIWNHSIRISEKAARGFYIFCLLLSLAGLVITLLAVSGGLSVKAGISLALLPNSGAEPRSGSMGAAISSAVLALVNAFGHFTSRITSEAVRSFVNSKYLLNGLCVFCSASFFAAEFGKSAHDAEMRQFFLESGYPIWFLYFITTAETLGSIGLLVSKTVVPAAFGLTIIMFGAIYTHYHNNDPFSDSLDALRLLVLLGFILVVRLDQSRRLLRTASNNVTK